MSEKSVEYIHEGGYVAEVDVELQDDAGEWSPAFTVQDAMKLDRVRQALKKGDLKAAARDAKIYEMRPVDFSRFAAE